MGRIFKCEHKDAKESVRGWCRVCYQKNYAKHWYLSHKNLTKKRAKQWAKKNKERRKEISRMSAKRRYKLNPQKFIRRHTAQFKAKINFRIAHNLRSRIRHTLKGIDKSRSTLKLLGCSIKSLKRYLERLFEEGMTWKNYGFAGWHIDHVRPCALFNLKDPEQQKACFHYTNLQPLWRFDNQSKGCRS